MSAGIELLMAELDSARDRVKGLEELLGEFAPEDESRDRPTTWAEVNAADATPPEWLWSLLMTNRVAGLLAPRSVGFMAADSRSGKSLFLMNLALCAARGTPFLDSAFSRPLSVLYVAAEGSRPMTFKRAREVGNGLIVPADADIPFFFQPDGVPHGEYVLGRGRVDRWIERARADIVILDTVGYFHDGDENSAMEMKRHVMRPLYALTMRHGCSVIVVHHNKKQQPGFEGHDGSQKGRGSGALFADSDFWWRMETPPPSLRYVTTQEKFLQYRTLHIDKNKYEEDGQEIGMLVNFRTATFARRAGTAGTV